MSEPTRRIGREQVQTLIREEQAQLIEVLPRSAFEPLHLPNALNIPLTDLDEASVGQLDRIRPIILYCYDNQ